MPFGINDTSSIDLPANIDAAYIEALRTEAGVEFPQILTEIDNRLVAFNGATDPLAAALLAPPTDGIEADDFRPAAFKFEESSEYSLSRAQHTDSVAVPLPIRKWDASVGFTEDGLESMSLPKILQQVDSLLLGLRRLERHQVISRLFKIEEIKVDPQRSTMTSPGFAGSGTGSNVFVGPYPNGDALEGGYTHYYRDTTANRATAIKAGRNRLKKWYPNATFELVGSATTIAAIAALPDFTKASSPLVRQGSGANEALVDPLTYVGVYDGDIRVRQPISDISADYCSIFVTFGNFNRMNPLIWRYDPKKGRKAYIRSRSLYPLDQAEVIYRFGIGVNNRTGAVVIKFDVSGDYTSPTIVYI